MKTTFFSLLFLLVAFSLCSQTPYLYGMTSDGGKYCGGVIFKTDVNGNNFTVVHDFKKNDAGVIEHTDLTEGNNGKLYGLSRTKGINGFGVIFEYDTATKEFNKLFDFDGNYTGKFPEGELLYASNGKLYGMTSEGGVNALGVFFEFDPITKQYLKILDFTGLPNGSLPQSSLMQASNGLIYGLTVKGGANNKGVIFEYNIVSGAFSKKHDFVYLSGAEPYSKLIQAYNGKLYGLTRTGGANGKGVLFEYNIINNTYSKKIDFDGISKGEAPFGTLLEASNGKLYGLTSNGGTNSAGVLFEYNITTDTFTKRHDFSNSTTGSIPLGKLVQAANSKMYGVTSVGGTNNKGVLFEYNTSNHSISAKINFGVNNISYNPYGGLCITSNNHIFGITKYGGHACHGVLFEYNPLSGTFYDRIDLNESKDPFNPWGNLIQASNGKLYGTTYSGGINACGGLFEFDPVSYQFSKKIDFDYTQTGFLSTNLVEDTLGVLWGTNRDGGLYGDGNIFMYNPILDTFIVKFSFNQNVTGTAPGRYLVFGLNYKLYGVTYNGGSSNNGTIFEYTPSTNQYVKVFDFNSNTTGNRPIAGLILTPNGNLIGMNGNGGAHFAGVIFEFDPDTNQFSTLHNFNYNTTGKWPEGRLVYTRDGIYYGLTSAKCGYDGALFEYNSISNTVFVKHIFQGSPNDGEKPRDDLILSSNGKLYGMTSAGGFFNKGILFEYDFITDTFTVKHNFFKLNGSNPMYSSVVEAMVCHTESYFNDSACGHYVLPSGNIVTQSGTYLDTIPNSVGCDSIITINLKMLQPDISVYINNDTLFSNATSAYYQWLDCDNAFSQITGAIDSFFVPTSNGNYAVEVTSTVNACADTSICYYVNLSSIQNFDNLNNIHIYPNPTSSLLNIELEKFSEIIHIRQYNIYGQLIVELVFQNTKEISFELVGQESLYFLEIERDNAFKRTFKVIKK